MIRFLHDPPLDGPTNMARDEALMLRVGHFESPPTLRLYRWDPPTISLGYFQRYADYESLPAPAGALTVVRRLTGGGAILHDLELTYSLILPTDHPLVAKGPNRLYELAHSAIASCLKSKGCLAKACGTTDDSSPTRGPFFCFERRHRYDLLVGLDKIAGSAQRRTRQAVLQHGSIVLGNRFAQQPTASISQHNDQDYQDIAGGFAASLARAAGITLEPGAWSNEELNLSSELIAKYSSDEWNRRV